MANCFDISRDSGVLVSMIFVKYLVNHPEVIVHFVGIVVAAWLIIWRIGCEHRNSLNLQKENMKDRLRLEIYRDLTQKISKANNALGAALSKITSLPINLETKQYLKSVLRFEPIPVEDRAETVSQLHFSAVEFIISLVTAMEEYEIAIPTFTSFSRTFCNQLEKFTNSFSLFYEEVLPFLPIDVPQDKIAELNTKVITPDYPDKEKLEELRRLANKYLGEVATFHGYLRDLSIEAQNHLLGSLFNRKLPPRKPTDPSIIVLSTDKQDKAKTNKEESN